MVISTTMEEQLHVIYNIEARGEMLFAALTEAVVEAQPMASPLKNRPINSKVLNTVAVGE